MLLMSLWGCLHVSSMSFSLTPWAGEWRQTFHFLSFLKDWHDGKFSKRARTRDPTEDVCYLTIPDWLLLLGERGCRRLTWNKHVWNHILSGTVLLSSFPFSCCDWDPGPVGTRKVLSHYVPNVTHLLNLWPALFNDSHKVTRTVHFILYRIFHWASSITKCFANLRVVELQSSPAELNNK